MGGLARKATVLDEQSMGINHFFTVDAGNLFFKSAIISDVIQEETAQINSEIIVEAFNHMGCDAFSPGSYDFASGVSYLLELENRANFPFISSNIFNLDDNLIFQPYVIKRANNYNIAFIGLASTFISENIEVKNPIESLKLILSSLEDISDFNILLFNGNSQDIQELYMNNLNIDLIILSKDKKRSSDGGSRIPTFSLGDRGKIVYQFDITLNESNEPLTDIAWCNNTIQRVNDRLDKMKKGNMTVDLKELYKDNEATIKRINNYEKQIELANQKLENAQNVLTFKKNELSKTIVDRIDILKIVDEGKLKLKSLTTPILPSP